jgi:hypothetical protein
MTRHVQTSSSRRSLFVALLLAGFLLFAFAPTVSAQTETTAPPATDPPTETTGAPDDGGDETDETDDGDGNEKLLIALLIGGALVGGVALIASLLSRGGNSAPAAPAAAAPVAPAPPSPKRQLLGNIQWLHDQLSLELLTGSADQASQRWASERGRTDNMSIQAQQIAAGGGGAAWQQLASSVSGLSAALDTAINLRADDQADPTIVSESVAVVNRKRSDLLRSIGSASQY